VYRKPDDAEVEIIASGDTSFLQGEYVDKLEFREVNDQILDKKVIMEAGDSPGSNPARVVSPRELSR